MKKKTHLIKNNYKIQICFISVQHNLTLTFSKLEKLFVNICCQHLIVKMLIPAIREKKTFSARHNVINRKNDLYKNENWYEQKILNELQHLIF